MVLWLALGSRRRFWEQAFTFGSMVLTNAVGERYRAVCNGGSIGGLLFYIHPSA